MLIRFLVENFLSFNQEVEFSMVAGRSRQHPNHITTNSSRNCIDILKMGVIYGANAAGKSNLIAAMSFARKLIVRGTKAKKAILLSRFKLNHASLNSPAKFTFEFKQGDKYYLYGFELDTHRIHSEWLYEINKSSQKLLFERKTDDKNETTVEFGHVKYTHKTEEPFFQFIAKGTRANQLFLTETIERGIKDFEHVHEWFSKSLVFISPDTKFHGLEIKLDRDENFREELLKLLRVFNTGISGIELVEVNFEKEVGDIPEELKADLVVDIEIGNKVILNTPLNKRYLIERNQNNEILAWKLMTKHKMSESEAEASFEVAHESDGTQRLMDLIPILINSANDDTVFIIDELDRSLHPSLSYAILEFFLANKSHSNQLIVTTHESTLLDLELLRRDEIWFVEKNNRGESTVYSLEEFTPRYDKDIRKGYLVGRFGAIPIMSEKSKLGWVK